MDDQSNTNGFIFDLNKCVGCHACVLACQIENGAEQENPWRSISTYNESQHPQLPVFHFSMACNHCDDAPCMEQCPALAFKKDTLQDTINHLADHCIGCKYCTWACPYDAPAFVNARGIVEKCTLCLHRIKENLKPACANLCPTGALDYGPIESKVEKRIPGFTEKGIGPHVKIVELKRFKAPELAVDFSKEESQLHKRSLPHLPAKVSFQKDWMLAIFTLMTAGLVGWFSAVITGFEVAQLEVFIGTGLVAMALSSFHLGKKERAWRSLLNLKSSWLSREVLFFVLFLASGLAWFVFPDLSFVGYFAALSGFACSWSADKVYQLFEKNTQLNTHSSSIFLGAILFTVIFTQNHYLILLLLTIKGLLYLYRKLYFYLHHIKSNYLLSLIRISMIIIPLLGLLQVFQLNALWFIVLIATGELIDRLEFYEEAEVITPAKQSRKDLLIKMESIESA